MKKKLLLQWVLTICLMIISQDGFAKTIILNINNGNSDGSLFVKNENVAIGDKIRFTNNLSYTINQQNGSFISDNQVGSANVNVNIAPGAYFEIVLTSVSKTQFTFVHSNFIQNKYYNSRINLTFTPVLAVDDTVSKANEKLEIFPNPCTDRLIIRSYEKMTGLELYDSTGKLMFNKKTDSSGNGNKEEISMSSYLKGSYLLRIRNSDGPDSVVHVIKQ